MKDFEITFAGMRKGESFEINHIFSRNEIYILFVLSGKCNATLNEVPYKLSAGDFLTSFHEGLLSYRFTGPREGAFCCVHAKLSEGQLPQESFFLSGGVHRALDHQGIKSAFSKIIREYNVRTELSPLRLSASFTELMCTLSQSRRQYSDAVKEAIKLAHDISKDFTADIDVSTYADRVGLSKDRFSVIFREQFGYAPYKYRLMHKINEATFLLTHTDLSVGEISDRLAFSNQLYFSSAYKAQTGLSPTQARKKQY